MQLANKLSAIRHFTGCAHRRIYFFYVLEMFALLFVARTGTKHTLISTSWRSSISSISRSLLRSWALESSSSFLLISQNALILSYNSMPGLSRPRSGNAVATPSTNMRSTCSLVQLQVNSLASTTPVSVPRCLCTACLSFNIVRTLLSEQECRCSTCRMTEQEHRYEGPHKDIELCRTRSSCM